jgi:hypothetical protein
MIRFMATDCKAVIAMARDPMPVSWCLEHGAPGAIQQAIDLGYAYLKVKKGEAAVKAAAKFLGGELVEKGRIAELKNEARGGFDVGTMTIEGRKTWKLGYMNEYMTLELDGRRVSTYPDLMTTFDADGTPITSTSLRATPSTSSPPPRRSSRSATAIGTPRYTTQSRRHSENP